MGDFKIANGAKSFIDSPVERLIEYFTRQMHNYMDIAIQLGIILALLGIIWQCIQMVFGTLEQRKFLVNTITKWFLFIFILTVYPMATAGLRKFSIEMATYVSGASLDAIAEEFGSYLTTLEEALAKNIADQEAVIKKLNEEKKNSAWDIYNLNDPFPVDDSLYWDQKIYSAEKKLAEINSEGSEDAKGVARTINAIRSVLIVDDTNITKKYSLDLEMKNDDGSPTGYLSANAMLRMSLLAAQIMWQKMWENDVEPEWEENASKGVIKSKLPIDFPLNKIFDIILCFLTEILVVFITCIEMIQYVMCIIEFIICVTFGILLVPCLLFDGTNDMAQKLFPTLIAQAVKLAMITICMYFCCYTYLDMAKNIIADTGSFNIWTVSYVVFTALISFALCSNAPKLASALLTGQPQMSMGEFIQAAGTIGVGATLAGKGVEATRVATGAVSRFGVNRLGDANAMVGGMRAGFENGKDKNGEGSPAYLKNFRSAIAGGAKVGAIRTGRRIAGAFENDVNYRGKRHGGGGGFGGGSGPGDSRFGYNYGKNYSGNIAHPSENEMQKREDRGFETDLLKNNTMNYDNHKTINGTKSTVGEYLKSQNQTGYDMIRNKGKPETGLATISGGTTPNPFSSGDGNVPPMPPSVPFNYGSNVNYTPRWRDVTPKPEALPQPGLPDKRKRSSGAIDVDFTTN